MKRPIFILLSIYILSIFVYEEIIFNINLIAILSIVTIILIAINKKLFKYILLFIFSLLILSFRFSKQSYIQEDKKIFVEIVSKKDNNFYNTYVIKNKGELYLFEDEKNYNEGQVLEISGSLNKISGQNNFNVYNKRKYYRSKKIFYKFIKNKVYSVRNTNKIKYIIKNNIIKIIEANLNKKNSLLLKAMILGTDSSNEFDEYRDLGLAHILAISGLHINILIGILGQFAKILNISRKKFLIVIITVLLFYGYIINYPVSIIRAILILLFSWMAVFTKNIKDDLNIIALTSFISLLINPFYIYSLAYYLSFSAIYSITYLSKKLQKIFPKISDKLITSIALQIGLFPFMVYYFNSINLLSIPLNLIVLPIFSIVLFTSFILISTNISYLGKMIEILIYFSNLIILPFYKIKDYFIIKNFFTMSDIFIYFISLNIILNYKMIIYKTKKYRKYIFILVCFILIKNIYFSSSTINIIDVGQGDAVLIRHNNKNFLYDTGGNPLNTVSSGKSFYNYLKNNRVDTLESVFISHSDLDHMGNLSTLIENIKIKNIYSNAKINYKTKKVSKGEKLKFKNIEFNIIEDGLKISNSNDSSLVILLKVFNTNILLTGDIESVENQIKIKEKINFLKVAHHGSKNSTSKKFLENNYIEKALISVGENNRYGHPSSEVLERLKNKNIEIYRTDKNGNIEIKVNLLGYVIRSYNDKMDIFEYIKYLLY